MAHDKDDKKSYMRDAARFYFAAEPRSILTTPFLVIYGFFVLFYIDNVALALRYVLYLLTGSTALLDTFHLFWSLFFVISLVLPFSISLYSLFLVFEIWKRIHWSKYVKAVVTALVLVSGIIVISVMDDAARYAAGQPATLSFIEDMNLTGRI